MLIKNKGQLKTKNEYKYVIGLDLSTVSTGISLYDLKQNKFLDFAKIIAKTGIKTFTQLEGIHNYLTQWTDNFSLNPEELIILKEAQPQQYGGKTSIATLIAIAKLHGLVEYYFYSNGYPLLDISAMTIRANLLHSKADKIEISNEIKRLHPYTAERIDKEYDISDSMAVCLTFEKGMRKDGEKQIKELRAEQKKFKTDKKKKEFEEEIANIRAKYF